MNVRNEIKAQIIRTGMTTELSPAHMCNYELYKTVGRGNAAACCTIMRKTTCRLIRPA